MTSSPNPLQPAGHTRRRLHLDDEVDGAHVDAELEGAGGDHRGQATSLEVVLDQGALLLADRSVMCAGQHPRSALGRACLSHHLCGRPGSFRMAAARLGHVCNALIAFSGKGFELETFVPDLVEPGSQALGLTSGVGEDQRRAMLGDQVDDAFLDVWPDRGSPLGAVGRTVLVCRHFAQRGHVGYGDDHLEVPLLGRRRLDDGDRSATCEEACDLIDRPHGGREADPLSRLVQQGIQPFQTQCQVRAALRAGDCVDLIQDHGLDTREGLTCL